MFTSKNLLITSFHGHVPSTTSKCSLLFFSELRFFEVHFPGFFSDIIRSQTYPACGPSMSFSRDHYSIRREKKKGGSSLHPFSDRESRLISTLSASFRPSPTPPSGVGDGRKDARVGDGRPRPHQEHHQHGTHQPQQHPQQVLLTPAGGAPSSAMDLHGGANSSYVVTV